MKPITQKSRASSAGLTNNDVELIEFYLGGGSYGVNISKVIRVIALSECIITPIADSPPCIAGITHVDDEPIPVIDLCKALSIENTQNNDRRMLLILAFNRQVSAYLIDGVNKIHKTSWKSYKPLTRGVSNQHGYINGSVKIDEKVIFFLDIEQMLYELNPEATAKFDDELSVLSASQLANQQSCKLLLVEDSAVIRNRTLKGLKKTGFTNIEAFTNGREAHDYILSIAEKETGFNHIVVTDVEMPEMDGLTLCNLVKQKYGKDAFQFIVYSSLINDQMKRKCTAARADDIVSKPDMIALVKAIEKLMADAPVSV